MRVFTKLANLPILKSERTKKKKNIIIEKWQLYPKYEIEVTKESRKLDSSGKLFEGPMIFSKSEGAIFTPLYIRVKIER